MEAVVGPILNREGGYAFDYWTSAAGLVRGYAYRRIEDAYYATGREQIRLWRERSSLSNLRHRRRILLRDR